MIIAAVGVALLVGDKFVRAPLYEAWKSRKARIADLTKKLAQGRQLIERERTIHERWRHISTNTLPSNLSQAEGQVLKAFDQWSQDSRISIAGIKPQWKHPADDYMTLECRADAAGNIQAVSRFLYAVEKDPLAFKVDSVEITSKDSTGQQLTLALQVSALLLNPPEQQ